MSRFFKALEQAERDRLHRVDEPAAAPAPEASAEPRTAPPRATEPIREPELPPAPRLEPRPAPWGSADGLRPEEHLSVLHDPTSIEAERYRSLQDTVERLAAGRGRLVLAITSPVAGDGKTLTAINLAAVLAHSGRRTLLVDADLRGGSIEGRLGMKDRSPRGLVDGAERDMPLATLVQETPWTGLDLLPGGRRSAVPYDTLQSARLPVLMEEARKRYDFVVVDTPPVVPVADCRLIEKWIDLFLLVVAADHTPRGLVEESLRILDPARIAGIVFNGAESGLGSSSYYYDYGHSRAGSASSRKSLLARLFGR